MKTTLSKVLLVLAFILLVLGTIYASLLYFKGDEYRLDNLIQRFTESIKPSEVTDSNEVPPAGEELSEKNIVVLISLDGLRGDLISETNSPFLYELAMNGAYTFDAKTITQSQTLPSHTSMLTGVTQEKHGVDWNNFDTSKPLLEKDTLFDMTESIGSIGIVSKKKMIYFNDNVADDNFGYLDTIGAQFFDYAQEFVKDQEDLNQFIFVHVRDLDTLGHEKGWGSEEQLSQLALVDKELNSFADFLTRNFKGHNVYLLVTADHGGLDTRHGLGRPEDLQIPFIVFGREVQVGYQIEENVNVYDATCVTLEILEINVDTDLDCKVPDGVLN